jgi:exopolysaccharide biosynthesis polyprenyl glycosylphosphotransferase
MSILERAWSATQEAAPSGRPRAWQRNLLEIAIFSAAIALAGLAIALSVGRHGVAWLVCYGLFLVLFDRIARSPAGIGPDLLNELRNLVVASALAATSVLALRLWLTGGASAASDTLRIGAISTAFLAAGKLVVHTVNVRGHRLGQTSEPTLIIGAGHVGQLTAKRLLEHPELGLAPIGFLDKEPLSPGDRSVLPILGASWDLDGVIETYGVRRVIFTFSTAPHEVMLRMLSRCQEQGVAVSIVPRLFERVGAKLGVDHIGGLPFMSVHTADPTGWQFGVKYVVDRVAAGLLLFLGWPIVAGCAATVWLLDGGPVLFRQRRVGRDGRQFDMVKFRSMTGDGGGLRPHLPADVAPGGIEGGVDRRTKSGIFLRRTSLDELPQLFNVLRGEMSLVGPRPERPEFIEDFEGQVVRYRDRLRVKSGITGWAQVQGLRGPTSLSDRVEWDNYYIENWSLALDLRILAMTARILLGSGMRDAA